MSDNIISRCRELGAHLVRVDGACDRIEIVRVGETLLEAAQALEKMTSELQSPSQVEEIQDKYNQAVAKCGFLNAENQELKKSLEDTRRQLDISERMSGDMRHRLTRLEGQIEAYKYIVDRRR